METTLKFLSPVVQSSPVTDICLLAKATLGCGKTEETNMYHRMAFMVYALCSCMYYNEKETQDTMNQKYCYTSNDASI